MDDLDKVYREFLYSVRREQYIREQPWWRRMLIRWGWIKIEQAGD